MPEKFRRAECGAEHAIANGGRRANKYILEIFSDLQSGDAVPILTLTVTHSSHVR